MRSIQAFTAPAHQRVLPGCHFSRQDPKWNIYPHAYSPGFIVMDWLLRAGREPEGHVFSSSRSPPSSSSQPSFCSKKGGGVVGGFQINAQKHMFGECLCLLNGIERAEKWQIRNKPSLGCR
ncbi:hypothetical protein TNIN_64521 [Trichonephila inaurata madagascariensis]|uniref:Uncharacterized protein n=1 Tax=Trichonephila inaurata madagascariensis TaxID=2747483 RepID=A0A8X6YI25_9ARAC|nr:hypothetical protein TNIN_64521 [Trichonephila inaurata madagascariensis]